MLLFAIDDEPKMLRLLRAAMAQAAPEAEIRDFPSGAAAVAALEGGARPDAVFSDIQMPGLDGLELAAEIKRLSPDTGIVFVTGYDEYAMEAYRLHVSGYVMKPVDAARVREELDHLNLPPAPPEPDKLRVRCFSHFEVFWRGEPVIFQRKQTKELLAYLIDREGRACSAEEIAAALWENDGDTQATKHRLRNLLTDLRKTLRGIGMEDLLIRERRQLAIRQDLVDCDYYRMLEGDMEAVNAYRGEYMVEYSWAELTAGRLQFRK